MTEPHKPKFHFFGDWRDPKSGELSERGRMLTAFFDGTAEPSADLLAVLREEMTAHERYRAKLHTRLVQSVRALSIAADSNVAELELPRGPDEQYAAGYHAGLYRAYADATQALGAIDAEATAEVML